MAEQSNDGGRPRGNRPADNAKQATPGSLGPQLGWQGGAMAGDFLGLNDSPAPAPNRAPAQAAVPLGEPRPSVAHPQSRAREAAELPVEESWLLGGDEPEASRPTAHPAPTVTNLGAPASRPGTGLPRAPNPTPVSLASVASAEASVEEYSEEQTVDEAQSEDSAQDLVSPHPRAPAVLDASWTEPRPEKQSSKRPVLVGACVASLLAIGGYIYISPGAPVQPGSQTDTVVATGTTDTPTLAPTPGETPEGPAADAPSAGAPKPGSEPAADAAGTVDPNHETVNPTPEASAESPLAVDLEAPPSPSEEPLAQVQEVTGRTPVDFNGKPVENPMPFEIPAGHEPESGGVPPAEPGELPGSVPEVRGGRGDLARVAPPQAPVLESGASPGPIVPVEPSTSQPTESVTAATPVAAREPRPADSGALPEPSPLPPASAPSTPEGTAPVASTAPGIRPRFTLPGEPGSSNPAVAVIPEPPKAGEPGPAIAQPGTAPAVPSGPANQPVSGAPVAAGGPQPGPKAPKGPEVAPTSTPAAENGGALAAEGAGGVKVLGARSATPADGAGQRPGADEHPTAVPTVPPVAPALAAVPPAHSGIPGPTGPSGPPNSGNAPLPGTSPDQTVAASEAQPPPAHETREDALPPHEVVLPAVAMEGVRAAEGKDLDGVWTGTSVPMDRVASPTKLLTPSVGDVRVTLKSKDVFEGRLYAVGQNSVWIEGAFGRLGLASERITSVDRLADANAAAANAAPGLREGRVRIKTGNTSLLGRVVGAEGTKVKVVTDNGLKLTVEAKDVEVYLDPPKIVVKQEAKQG